MLDLSDVNDSTTPLTPPNFEIVTVKVFNSPDTMRRRATLFSLSTRVSQVATDSESDVDLTT